MGIQTSMSWYRHIDVVYQEKHIRQKATTNNHVILSTFLIIHCSLAASGICNHNICLVSFSRTSVALTQKGEATSTPSVLLDMSRATLIESRSSSAGVVIILALIRDLVPSVKDSMQWANSPLMVFLERVGVFSSVFFNSYCWHASACPPYQLHLKVWRCSWMTMNSEHV